MRATSLSLYCFALLVVAPPTAVAAQVLVDVPRWTAEREWSSPLDRMARAIAFAPTAALGAGDTIVLPLLLARQLRILDHRGQLVRVIDDVGRISGVGFIGDSIWLADGSTRRFEVYPPGRSRPAVSRRYAAMFGPSYVDGDATRTHWIPLGLAASGRVVALTEAPLASRRAAEDLQAHDRARLLLRDPESGKTDTLGVLDTFRAFMQTTRYPGATPSRVANPLKYRELVAMNGAGTRIVLVDFPSPQDTITGKVIVTAWNADGSLAFRRSVPARLQAITGAEIDAAAGTRIVRSGGAAAPAAALGRDDLLAANPPGSMRAPFERLVVGRDGSVWLLESGTQQGGVVWLLLGANGTPRARVAFPRDAGILLAADAASAWVLESPAFGEFSLAKYRIAPTTASRP